MAAKYLVFVVIAALVFQGHCVNEIFLPDQTINYISNPLIGVSMSIAKFWTETLLACYITFPNGVMYEAYPNSNIPYSNIFFMNATAAFRSCAVGFRGVGVETSGTYELLSMIEHNETKDRSITRQKFHLRVTMTEVEFP